MNFCVQVLLYLQMELIRFELRRGAGEPQQMRLSVASAQVDCQLPERADGRDVRRDSSLGTLRSSPPAVIFAARGEEGRALLSSLCWHAAAWARSLLLLALAFAMLCSFALLLAGYGLLPRTVRADKCSEITTCDSCLAAASGCFGWFGDSCCSQETCLEAAQGDREFWTSCPKWQQHVELSKVCSNIPANDSCACIKAGCVAQEITAGLTACFASYQPAAGNQLFPSDVNCGQAESEKPRTGNNHCCRNHGYLTENIVDVQEDLEARRTSAAARRTRAELRSNRGVFPL
eukprot:s323_g24.t1